MHHGLRLTAGLLAAVILAACVPAGLPILGLQTSTPAPTDTPRPTSTPPATPTPSATPTPTATPEPLRIALHEGAPAELALAVDQLIAAEPFAYRRAQRPADAGLQLAPAGAALPGDARGAAERLLYEQVLAPVVPFPTLADEVAFEDIRRYWAGEPGALAGLSGGFGPPALYVMTDTLAALTEVLGPPAEGLPIVTANADELLGRTWEARPRAWAIVPFDALEPRWKVLRLDGQSVLDKALALETYPLARRWIASGPEAALEALATQLGPDGRLTNRDVSRLAVIAMTGVTAPSRHTMEAIERAGDPLYPGRGVAELLSAADLTHISNEVAFLDRCPPGEVQGGALCGRPEYHALLAAVGADVIELTGNHMNDYGRAAFGDTIRAYYDAGLVTYGGGLTLAAAQTPAILEVAGNRIAFLGCNTVGPDFAFATAAEPGAAPCDYERLFAQLAELREQDQADVIVFTYQYLETQDGFYHYESTEPQRRDFQRMAAAGADIVSGSQAHQPQGFSFTPDGRFISYGLGNLFFDQMFSLGTRQGLIERHTVYAGRHISTELITTLLYDYAQPQITTEDERSALLYTLFAVSDW